MQGDKVKIIYEGTIDAGGQINIDYSRREIEVQQSDPINDLVGTIRKNKWNQLYIKVRRNEWHQVVVSSGMSISLTNEKMQAQGAWVVGNIFDFVYKNSKE